MLAHTPTPMGTLLAAQPSNLQLLGAGRRAATLRSRVRAVKRFLDWLAVSHAKGYPTELHDYTGYLGRLVTSSSFKLQRVSVERASVRHWLRDAEQSFVITSVQSAILSHQIHGIILDPAFRQIFSTQRHGSIGSLQGQERLPRRVERARKRQLHQSCSTDDHKSPKSRHQGPPRLNRRPIRRSRNFQAVGRFRRRISEQTDGRHWSSTSRRMFSFILLPSFVRLETSNFAIPSSHLLRRFHFTLDLIVKSFISFTAEEIADAPKLEPSLEGRRTCFFP